MGTRVSAGICGLIAAAMLAGCSNNATSAKSDAGTSPGSGGAGGGSPATGGSGGAAGGAGGAGSGGSSGFGGSGGAAGMSADAGVGRDAAGQADAGRPDAPTAPACAVTITPTQPQRLVQLPWGPTATLRVRATVSGTSPPAMPMWMWMVTHYETGTAVKADPVNNNPAEVQIKLERAGRYDIRATARAGCSETVIANAEQVRTAHYWIRATPPTGTSAAPSEGIQVDVPGGVSPTRDIPLSRGMTVSIDPQAASGVATIPSYVRVTSAASSVRLEGHTKAGPFRVALNPLLTYQVLVIPDVSTSPDRPTVAPALVVGTPSHLMQTPFMFDDGVEVTGTVTSAMGPVDQARVLLRANSLPSTVGRSASTGAYSLRARSGAFTVVVVPPAGSSLPEAQTDTSTVIIDSPPPGRVSLDFAWASVTTFTLDLTVRNPDDGPLARPVRVRLESELSRVGAFTVDGVIHEAPGSVGAEGVTNAGGLASFAGLPRGVYHALLSPGDDSTANTMVEIDLTQAAAREARRVRLGRKVTVSGVLTPAARAAGATVIAVDPSADPAAPVPAAVVDSNGRYALALDPGPNRQYRLFVEPVLARAVPRTSLGTMDAPTADLTLDPRLLPDGRAISGVVTLDGTALTGAVVQAYCVGDGADCVDPVSLDTEHIRAAAEAVSGANGSYRLLIPDPATGN
jgi:hypothetical protein